MKETALTAGGIMMMLGFFGFAFAPNKPDGSWTKTAIILLVIGIIGLFLFGYGTD